MSVNFDNEDGCGLRTFHALTGDIHLIGMIHGHWDVEERDLNRPRPARSDGRGGGVNIGIAIVIRAEKILETLDHPELVAAREEQEAEFRETNLPVWD
jgi:hypothetical protein